MKSQLMGSFRHLVEFVQACSPTLRSLRVGTWFLDDDNMFGRLLESLGSVEDMCIDTWFREGESVPSRRVDVMPKLRRLCIHHHDDDGEEPEQVDDTWGEWELTPRSVTPDVNETSVTRSNYRPADENDITELNLSKLNLGGVRFALEEHDSLPTPRVRFQEENPGRGTTSTLPPEPDAPSVRGPFSWSSLGAFVVACANQRMADEGTDGDLNADIEGARDDLFTFCASGLARRKGGKEARRTFRELERVDGVCVLKEPVCTIYW